MKLIRILMLISILKVSAYADIAFSGSGASGTLSAPSETWVFNADGGALETGYLNNWGSPGVGLGTTAYGETQAAYGMQITFTGGGTIDAASIQVGNSSACHGSTGGGTTFCTISPTDIWEAFQTGPSSIKFLAQDPSFFLSQGQSYFVNIFFDGETPTAFTGSWLTSFSPNPNPAPEPATWSLGVLCAGLFGVGKLLRKKRMSQQS